MEIVHGLEAEFDGELGIIIGQLVVDAVGQPGFHALEHLVEIVAIDFDKLPVLQAGERLIGLAGKIAEHADHKRDFFHLNGVSNLHVVGQVDPWRPHSVQFVLQTFCLGHNRLLS